MANFGGLKETHRVAVLNKKQHTNTLASAFVKDLDSKDTFSIKFQGSTDVNTLMNNIEKGVPLIVEGYMGTSKFGRELAVQSFEYMKKKASN